MNLYIKIILVSFVFGFLFTFINVSAGNDCDLLNNTFELNSQNNNLNTISSIYPQKDIQVAINHLIYFCCENGYVKKTNKYCPKLDSQGKLLEPKLYAQSPYLYDQIIDIGLRRLDGDYKTQYKEAGLDNKGKERRERIRTASQLINGIAPISIIDKYQNLWKPGDNDDNFVSNNISMINNKRNNYGLKNRYFAMCFISDYVEESIKNKKAYNKREIKGKTKKCFGLVDEIIQKEFSYMKWVMIQQGAKLIAYNMSTYTDDYFTRGRLQSLLEKFANMQAMFLMINQKINEGTNQCTKK